MTNTHFNSKAHQRRLNRQQGFVVVGLTVLLSIYLIATAPDEPMPVPTGPGFETCTDRSC